MEWLRPCHCTHYAVSGDALSTHPRPSFFPGGLPFARRDQTPQAVVDIEAPCAGTVAVALEGGNQAEVRKAKLGFVSLSGDLKDNLGALPLRLVFDESKLGLRYVPHDFLARHQFRDLLGAAVNVLVVELKLSAEFVGVTSISSDHHPRTLLMASKTSCGVWSTDKVVV